MSEHTTIDGIDYGPLAALVGRWEGSDGMDVAPEPDGDEHNPFFETIEFEAAGDVTNAEQQTLSVVRYHQVVSRKSNNKVFHDQVGFWLWDPADNTVTECFVIPRAVGVVASGTAGPPAQAGDEVVLSVTTDAAGIDSGVTQAAFMFKQARTTGFSHRVTVKGDSMSYQQTTVLDIYGKHDYPHTDENTLRKVG